MSLPGSKRLLFVGEAATLAHVARPYSLARSLANDPSFTLAMACDRRAHGMLAEFPGAVLHLTSQSSEAFVHALEAGRPVFSLETLRGYVHDDLLLLQQTRPDVVIGDFRLSLAVSARLTATPYLTISNAYWSPYHQDRSSVPDLPILTRWLPIPIAQKIFNLVRPLAFAAHAHPMERLLREYGLPGLGHNLRRVYTEADVVLYADIPATASLRSPPAHHRYLGALAWDPPCGLPEWWEELSDKLPLIYLTLGSSGRHDSLEQLLRALSDLKVTVMLSTAGHSPPDSIPSNVHVAPYLPGSLACARAQLVIGNGGSPTTQQALVAGKPVIGICRNLDQYLNMSGVAEAGAGLILRSDRLDAAQVRAAVQSCLRNDTMRQQARQLQAEYRHHAAGPILREALKQLDQHSARPK